MSPKVGAQYFDELVDQHPGIKIGISGGNTIYAMIQALSRRERNMTTFPTALIGRGPLIPEHIDPMVLLSVLREKSGANPPRAYHVTLLPFEKGTRPVEVRAEYERLKKHQKVKEVWAGMQDVEAVFASVGAIHPSAEYVRKRGRTLLTLLSDLGIDEARLEKQGAVGDISYALFDEDGRTRSPDWDFFMTLGVDFFRKMAGKYPQRRVVLIAGQYKESSLRACLRGALCNVLITDTSTAEKLLEGDDAQNP